MPKFEESPIKSPTETDISGNHILDSIIAAKGHDPMQRPSDDDSSGSEDYDTNFGPQDPVLTGKIEAMIKHGYLSSEEALEYLEHLDKAAGDRYRY